MLLGGGLLAILVFAVLLADIGRVARDRGRSAALWALVGAPAGIAAFILGMAVFDRVMSDDVSAGVMLLAILAPLAFMIAAMRGISRCIRHSRVKVSQRDEWKVHIVSRGDGCIKIVSHQVRFEWAGGSHTVHQNELETIEADGECVRIKAADLELSMLPTGMPDSPAGRREQSQVLARRLRTPLPRARFVTTRT